MHMPVTSQLCFLLISTRVRLVANDAPGLPQPGGHVWLKPMADDAVPRLTKAMLSGPRDVFILYQRDDENGTKYKIQRTLAEGARDIQCGIRPSRWSKGCSTYYCPASCGGNTRMKRPGSQRRNLRPIRIPFLRAG